MAFFRRDKHNCFCAFCRTPRRIYRKKNINFINILSSVLMAAITMYVFWQGFDPRVSVVFVFYLAVAEVFVKIRWRLSLSCPQCGFDPILYVKDAESAVAKVRQQLRRRKEDPRYMLAPQIHLPTIAPDRALVLEREQQAKEKKGTLVSRQI